MNKKTYLIYGAVTLTVIAFSAASAFAFNGKLGKGLKDPQSLQQFQQQVQQRHDEMVKVFANKDFDSWYKLMTQNGKVPKIVGIVTKDNFAQFAEAHLMIIQAQDKLKALGVEGLGGGMFGGMPGGQGMRGGMMKGTQRGRCTQEVGGSQEFRGGQGMRGGFRGQGMMKPPFQTPVGNGSGN